jgi:hypothetical protein
MFNADQSANARLDDISSDKAISHLHRFALSIPRTPIFYVNLTKPTNISMV